MDELLTRKGHNMVKGIKVGHNFYDLETHAGMGELSFWRWINRAKEFPQKGGA